MRLSPKERQTLLGPLVIGAVVGAFVAYATFAVNSEFRLNGIPIITAEVIGESAIGFLLSVAGTVSLLGLLPIFIHRWRSKDGIDV